MLIRPVEQSDVVSLRENCFSLITLEQMQEIVESAIENAAADEGVMLVAVNDDAVVVGNVTVTRQAHRLRRHRASLGGFVIHPSARGSGLARDLTRAAAEWCRSHSCTILELDCRGGTPAEQAYRGLGVTEWGRLPGGFIEDAGTFDQVNFSLRVEDWLVAQETVHSPDEEPAGS